MDKSFEVCIKLVITKDGEPFSETEQDYHRMKYEDIVAVQKALADVLVGLGLARLAKK